MYYFFEKKQTVLSTRGSLKFLEFCDF